MRLYIIRHADPDYENDTITGAGHLEAEALAKKLYYEGIDKIYCSPLGRARATAEYTAKLLKIDTTIEDWTEEFHYWIDYSPYGNIHVADIPGEVVRFLGENESHESWHLKPPYSNSECMDKINSINQASDNFIKRHGYERDGERYRCVRPNELKLAVFCHAALGLVWLSHLLGIPATLMWTGFWPAPSSVTTILFEERSKDWAVPRCTGFGDVSHLYESRLPVSHMGLKGNHY